MPITRVHIVFDIAHMPTLTPNAPKKKHLHRTFKEFLFDNNIMNARHYDKTLETSDELRELEMSMHMNNLEAIKKTIFRQVYLRIRYNDVLSPRVVESSDTSQLGALTFLLCSIATQNQMSVDRLKQLLCNFIFSLNHKKRGLILCGPSDSGKSFLSNLLYSSYLPHEIGYFNCPTGQNVSPFMLQALSNCLAYRCDEMVFEYLGIIQIMKQLLEGSITLTTDIKYKDSMPIDPHPTLITMNASSANDILKWHPGEYQAFENRCTILFLGTPLNNLFNNNELYALSKCGPELLYMLSLYKKEHTDNTFNALDKFSDFVTLH